MLRWVVVVTLSLSLSPPQRWSAGEEASERLHALHEGDETQSAAGGAGERERRHQPHPGTQGETQRPTDPGDITSHPTRHANNLEVVLSH